MVGAALMVDQARATSSPTASSPLSRISRASRVEEPISAQSEKLVAILSAISDGSPLQVHGPFGRFTGVGSLAGIAALHSPMMSDQPWLNFTGIEQLV